MIKDLLVGNRLLPSFPSDLALTALRVYAGLMLSLGHGLQKLPVSEKFISGVAALGFPQPVVFAHLAMAAELVGGFCLALGLLTRPASAFVAFTMFTAAFLQHANDPMNVKELALLYFFTALSFLFIGGGRLSLDRFLRGQA